MRVHNFAVPLTNMKHLPFEYIDVNATTHYFARVALNIVILLWIILILVTNQPKLLSLQGHDWDELDKFMQIYAEVSTINRNNILISSEI